MDNLNAASHPGYNVFPTTSPPAVGTSTDLPEPPTPRSCSTADLYEMSDTSRSSSPAQLNIAQALNAPQFAAPLRSQDPDRPAPHKKRRLSEMQQWHAPAPVPVSERPGTAAGRRGCLCRLAAQRPPAPPPQTISKFSEGAVRQRIRATYLYACAALCLTGLSGTACFYGCTTALTLNAPFILLALGVVLPCILLRAAVKLPPAHWWSKNLCWLGFNLLTGLGLSTTGTVGLTVLGPAALLTALAFAYFVHRAGRFVPPQQNGPTVYADGLAAFHGIALGSAMGTCLGQGAVLRAVQMGAGGLSLFVGGIFTLVHMAQVEKEAAVENTFDPIAHSLNLYVDLIGIFTGISRLLSRPAAAGPAQQTTSPVAAS
jgi:hypothetical protein